MRIRLQPLARRQAPDYPSRFLAAHLQHNFAAELASAGRQLEAMNHKVVYDRFTRLSIADASGTIRRMWSLGPLDEDGKLGWSLEEATSLKM